MNWKRAAIGALAAAPIVALLGFGLTRNPRDIPSPLPGREAPEFKLAVFAHPTAGDPAAAAPRVDTVDLARHRGEIVVLNFWASWCLACRDEHQALSDVAARYRGTPDVHFYGVLYNDSPANGRKWIAEMGGQTYPSVADPGARTAIDYGLYGVPETFFIGRDGRVAYKHTGPISAATLVAKVEELRRQPAAGAVGVPTTDAPAKSPVGGA